MEALLRHPWLRLLSSIYTTITTTLLSLIPKIQRTTIFVPIIDSIMSLYFHFLDLSPCMINLDDQTTMHFWVPRRPRLKKPNLVLIHGYGGNTKWQFMYQINSLAKSFNVYLPDLLFFGNSYTLHKDRSETFQAKCVFEGLERLGVERCTVYSISYGGFVGYRMAEIYPEMVEKVVIVSSGIGCTVHQKNEQLKNVGGNNHNNNNDHDNDNNNNNDNVFDLLLPEKPKDLRMLVNLSIYKFNPFKWIPDFFLQEFINMMCDSNRKEKRELIEHLLANQTACETSVLKQDALLVWGDKDKVFPLTFAYQLQRSPSSS
ncbi:serine protease [Lithospermum erythrorhizon]|uniref:Serine protease n=1 Tax=Lithospermum erythrorhizon TaxID=34254 RepID=A0AAV3QW54_LITER